MSTPRRPAPRSNGAPITATLRADACVNVGDNLAFSSMGDDPGAGAIRVLLADDDPPFLESLGPLIEHQPDLALVGTALDGLAAIELADELEPDAIVIDLHMPLVDGVTAVARLRRDHPSMCVIALTGDADEQLHRAVTEAGADAVLLKSELVETLLERLTAARTPA